jgi:hypothetical protein
MPFEQHQDKSYSHDSQTVYQAALEAVKQLDGQVVTSAPGQGQLVVKFPKTMLGKTLGERTHLTCVVQAQEGGSRVVVDAYPLDAIERKLMFGARKGVTLAVVTLFLEHLEQRLA